MKTTHTSSVLGVVAALYLGSAGIATAATVSIDISIVGNPGNTAEPNTRLGSVGYTFGIGTYDVTQAQYTAFLNAVAQTDPFGLYNPSMARVGNDSGLNTGAGIARSGNSGSYSYSVIGTSGNVPVTYVTWTDSMRFCNWLQNGQPTGPEGVGTTENGAYSVSAGTRNALAKWWIPTETEWFKAAYYDPSLNNGLGGYWAYATRSNSAPGNQMGNLPNQANYYTGTIDLDTTTFTWTRTGGVYSVTQSADYDSTQCYLSPVGAFTNSASTYGTYDQSGDVWEWLDSGNIRGGYCFSDSFNLRQFGFPPPYGANESLGFRVATSQVPEPNSLLLTGLGGILLASRRRKMAGL